jgi:uncharacterized membrane protein (DUF4010 family)
MRGPRTTVAMLVVFVAGLLAGIWQFISPWIITFPGGTNGPWGAPMWSSIWTAALVVGASGLAIVVVSAASLHATVRRATEKLAAEQAQRQQVEEE